MKTLADLTAPAEVTRKVLEKDLQEQCVAWARSRGYWARKFSSISQRSVPDYLFADLPRFPGPEVRVKFACEFKKPGTKAKLIPKYGVTVMSMEAQYEEQLKMREAGWFVFECSDFETFKKTVMGYERQCAC